MLEAEGSFAEGTENRKLIQSGGQRFAQATFQCHTEEIYHSEILYQTKAAPVLKVNLPTFSACGDAADLEDADVNTEI